jgi:hypothetical protein
MKKITLSSDQLSPEQRAAIQRFWAKNPPANDVLVRIVSTTQPISQASTAWPRDKWPLSVRLIERLKSEADQGAGDTLHRIINGMTGRRLVGLIARRFGLPIDDRSNWMSLVFEKITGRSCGCADRQAAMNRVFPYSAS